MERTFYVAREHSPKNYWLLIWFVYDERGGKVSFTVGNQEVREFPTKRKALNMIRRAFPGSRVEEGW